MESSNKKARLPVSRRACCQNRLNLAVTATAMGSATTTTVEAASASAMESTATTAAMEPAPVAASVTATREAAYMAAGSTAIAAALAWVNSVISAPVGVSTATIAIAAAAITTPSAAVATPAGAISVAAPAISAAPSPVVPGTGTDEDTACEPARTVIAVRGARVGVIGIVPPIADRRTIVIRSRHHRRPHADSNRNLGMGRSCKRHHQKRCYE